MIGERGKQMPMFIVTESRREIWQYKYEIEAENEDKAMEIYTMGTQECSLDESVADYIDTLEANFHSIRKV